MNDWREAFWNDLPIGKENAVSYPVLICQWSMTERNVRKTLHELSLYDNGDDYILIRSGNGKGFYKTDSPEEIKAYKRECLNKGRSTFAPVKKINRVLSVNCKQLSITNNLRTMRDAAGYSQAEVCDMMTASGFQGIDKPLLSKMENGTCYPTFAQVAFLASLYGCTASELLSDIYTS